TLRHLETLLESVPRMAAALLLVTAFVSAIVASSEHGPFTDDFVQFLKRNHDRNEYVISAFKEYGATGTFGGRTAKNQKIDRQPVLFVHGNSDSALHYSDLATGWTKSVEHFKEKAYTSAELYGLTYGARDINLSLQNSITCRNLLGLRRFIEAIIEYTEADKIDVVAHSMGVTLARKAVKGGVVTLSGESCDLGESLSDRVDSLVAISGANYGMCMCLMAGLTGMPACGQAGFAPGSCGTDDASMGGCMAHTTDCEEEDYASVLRAANAGQDRSADFIASLWSNDDAILGKNNLVWGRKTSIVPDSDFSHGYNGLDHFQTKDQTMGDQFNLVTKHSLHGGRAKRHH
ncbi:hypothetical protein PFISCL1PPCAC_14353, partial [Pristionchus fissidentatus]